MQFADLLTKVSYLPPDDVEVFLQPAEPGLARVLK